jgi:hypothetical protein
MCPDISLNAQISGLIGEKNILEREKEVLKDKIAEEKKAIQQSPFSSPSLSHERGTLTIHYAGYGLAPGREREVTLQMRELIERGERQVWVHPDTFGFPDPYEGQTKRLLVTFSYGNTKRKTITCNDYGYLNIPHNI